MNYKKYDVRSPLFALRDPRLSEQVLAAFSGALEKRLPAPPPPRRAPGQGSRGFSMLGLLAVIIALGVTLGVIASPL